MKNIDKSKVAKNNSSGFTIIEMLITIAIIGILTAIALPSYQDSQLRGGRAEGKAALLTAASLQEQYFSNNNAYLAQANPQAGAVTITTDSGKYQISVAFCVALTPSCFIATATPQGSQASDTECANFTLSSTGVKGTSAGVATDCWQR